jgi:hypothetical protein
MLILVYMEITLISALDAQFVPNVPRAWKSFWPDSLVYLVDVDQVEAHFG